jgi:hypothetical protein
MKKDVKLASESLEMDLEINSDVESFVYDRQSVLNSVTRFLEARGYKGHWATKEIDGQPTTDIQDNYAKGFRVCTRETDPEAAEIVMGPMMDNGNPSEEIRFKEMVLMKMPMARYNKFLEIFNRETQELKYKAELNKKMSAFGANIPTFNENESRRGHSLGD